MRIGTCHPEMSIHERLYLFLLTYESYLLPTDYSWIQSKSRSVDFYIDLLKKSQLDENVPLDNLEKGRSYFQQIYEMFLEGERPDCPTFLKSHVRAIGSAAEALVPEVQE